jgi:hypothetical protein
LIQSCTFVFDPESRTAAAAAVVLYHYLKTARMNPAETLKNE